MHDARETAEALRRENEVLRARLARLEPATGSGAASRSALPDEWERTFDALPDLICLLDSEHRILRINRAMAERLGAAPAALIGRTCYDCVHGLPQPPEQCPHARAVAERRTHEEEVWEERLGGVFRVTVTPLFDDEGRLLGSVHVARDITERKAADGSLRESEAVLNEAQELARLGSFVWDLRDDAVSYSQNMLRLFGFDRDSVPADSLAGAIAALIHPDDQPEIQRQIAEMVAQRRTWPMEFRIRRPDGEERILQSRSRFLFAEDGTPVKCVGVHYDVTDARRAAAALQESERRHRTLLSNLPGMAYQCKCTPGWPMTFVSDGARDLTGYSPEELCEGGGVTFGDLIHPDDRRPVWEQIQESIRHGRHFEIEYHIIRRDGAVRHVWERGRVVNPEDATDVMLEGFIADITARALAERALRESERRYRTLAENFPHGAIFLLGRDGRYLFCDGRELAVVGLDREHFMGRTVRDVFPPEVADVVEPQVRRLLAGEPVHYEVEFAGHVYQNDGVPIFGEDGQVHEVVVVTQRITERKQAEAALLASEEKFRALFEGAADCVIVHDLDGRVVDVNEAACRSFGYSREELLRLSVSDLDPDAEARDDQRLYWQTLRAGEPVAFETRHLRKDGVILAVEVRLNLVDYGEQTVVMAVCRDITARRAAEEERRNLERRMLELQKLESLGVLAGGIAHDFNNILTAVMGYAELALHQLSPVSPARDCIAEIEHASRRASDLCRQMLAYSGKGRFVISDIDINELISEMLHLLNTSISKKAVFNLNLADNLPRVRGDATQLRQVVMNLVINASDALEDKSGTISVSTGALYCDRHYLDETYFEEELAEGLYLTIEVADTGCGMRRDVVARIFEPFYTTKFTGRGLGLAAVLGIVRGHHGALKVYSEPGRGSAFKILLPAVTEPAAPEPVAARPDSSAWRGDGAVLLVDDEETLRALGKTRLESLGLTALTAADGREALALYAEHRDRIKCVVLDLTMPHMTGEEVFRQLRRIDPDVRVVISSGYSREELAARLQAKGIAAFLQKPYTLASLREALREALS